MATKKIDVFPDHRHIRVFGKRYLSIVITDQTGRYTDKRTKVVASIVIPPKLVRQFLEELDRIRPELEAMAEGDTK